MQFSKCQQYKEYFTDMKILRELYQIHEWILLSAKQINLGFQIPKSIKLNSPFTESKYVSNHCSLTLPAP